MSSREEGRGYLTFGFGVGNGRRFGTLEVGLLVVDGVDLGSAAFTSSGVASLKFESNNETESGRSDTLRDFGGGEESWWVERRI
jgi:hypothetical protein